MLDRQTKKRIDDCRDILVGRITDPKSQVEQITIAMIYKFMDDMDLQSEEYGGSRQFFVGDYQKYSWSSIFSPRVDANEMLNLYGEGIEKMSENPNLNPLFRKIFKDAYLPFRDAETLKLFLKTIDGFSYEHSEKLGDAYEYLLSVLGSQGGAGQFRTPRHIIDFIVDLVQPKKGDRILDPACGTSGFLISSYKRILERNTDKKLGDKLSSMEKKHLLNSIYGYDLDPNMVRLSLVNLFLHGFTEDELNVIEYDSLTSEDRWNEYFDVILANPPFMTPKGGIRPHNRFSIKSNRAEVLFVNYIMEHLTPKGRAGIIVPEGIIFQSGTAYKQLRKSLVEKYLIGVVSLPSGVFNPYSGVKTSILILDRELSQRTDKIFFGKVENDGYDLGSQRREIDKTDLPIITKEVTEFLGGLRNGKEVQSEKLKFVSKEQILSSNDIGLSYDRYNRTKVLVSSDFELVKLKNLLEIQSGYPFDSKRFNDSTGFPLIRIRNIKRNNTDTLYDGEILNDYIVNNGDILIGMDGEFNTTIWNGGNALMNQRVCRITKTTNVLKEYVFHLIQKKLKEIEKETNAVTVKHISVKQILDIEIPLPPIEVQEEIVRELEQIQKIIDGAKQVVDNYRPVIDIDPKWEMNELSNIVSVNNECGNPLELFGEGTFTYIDISSVESKTGKINLENIISTDDAPSRARRIIKKGDLIISSVRPNLKSFGYIDFNPIKTISSTGFMVVTPSSKIDGLFLYHLFFNDFLQNQMISKMEKGAYPSINQTDFNKLEIPVPPIEIQQSIVKRIESERQIIEGNKKLIEIYTQKIEDRINKIWGE